jgi:nucleoside phosphorylase
MSLLVVASSVQELEGVLTNARKVVVGVGKVQSAVRTMEALANFRCDQLLCIGYAGSVADGLMIGDMVQADSTVQYDIDLTHFGMKRCEVPNGENNGLLGKLTLPVYRDFKGKTGCFGTADLFLVRSYLLANPWMKDELHLLSCDMESYGVAYACSRMKVPCHMVRIISDDSQGHRPKRFPEFVRKANEQFSELLSVVAE